MSEQEYINNWEQKDLEILTKCEEDYLFRV